MSLFNSAVRTEVRSRPPVQKNERRIDGAFTLLGMLLRVKGVYEHSALVEMQITSFATLPPVPPVVPVVKDGQTVMMQAFRWVNETTIEVLVGMTRVKIGSETAAAAVPAGQAVPASGAAAPAVAQGANKDDKYRDVWWELDPVETLSVGNRRFIMTGGGVTESAGKIFTISNAHLGIKGYVPKVKPQAAAPATTPAPVPVTTVAVAADGSATTPAAVAVAPAPPAWRETVSWEAGSVKEDPDSVVNMMGWTRRIQELFPMELQRLPRVLSHEIEEDRAAAAERPRRQFPRPKLGYAAALAHDPKRPKVVAETAAVPPHDDEEGEGDGAEDGQVAATPATATGGPKIFWALRIVCANFATQKNTVPTEAMELIGATKDLIIASYSFQSIAGLVGQRKNKAGAFLKPSFNGGTLEFELMGLEGLESGAAQCMRRQILTCRLYDQHLVNAPSPFPPLAGAPPCPFCVLNRTAALIAGTKQIPPMAIQMQVYANGDAPDPRNNAGMPRPDAAADGYLQCKIKSITWLHREQVVRYGMRVTADAVLNGEFARGVTKRKFVKDGAYDKWIEGSMEKLEETKKRALARVDTDVNSDRMILLTTSSVEFDGPMLAKNAEFYAYPVYDVQTWPLEDDADELKKHRERLLAFYTGPDAEKRTEDDLKTFKVPKRLITIKPEDGDKFILGYLRNFGRLAADTPATATLADVLKNQPSANLNENVKLNYESGEEAVLPYFVFYAVLPLPAAVQKLPSVAVQPSRRRADADAAKAKQKRGREEDTGAAPGAPVPDAMDLDKPAPEPGMEEPPGKRMHIDGEAMAAQ